MNRVFILRTEQNAAQLMAFLKQNAKAMAQQNRPLEVLVREHKAKGTDEQRALMWVVLQQIAEQAFVAGRQYDADVWHIHFKRELLPEKTSKGKAKWRMLPDDTRELVMSTEDLDRDEKTAYLNGLLAAAAALGVEVHIEDRQH
jgi:hypothetical protein